MIGRLRVPGRAIRLDVGTAAAPARLGRWARGAGPPRATGDGVQPTGAASLTGSLRLSAPGPPRIDS